MTENYVAYGPKSLPRHLTSPATDLFYNVEVSARRFPEKPFLVFYDTKISFARFRDEAERLAGWLERQGVSKGDRVLLYMQNCPQFAVGFYGILRANAVAVPVNPMNLAAELRQTASDSGAKAAIVAQNLYPSVKPLLGKELDVVLLATYSDYLEASTDLAAPDFVKAPRAEIADAGVEAWKEALDERMRPGPVTVGPEDLCALIYTSGTTGHPKGCMHTHRSTMHTAVGGMQWLGIQQDEVQLAALPWFHVSGLQFCLNGPVYAGCTVAVLPRWDRDAAAACIERYGVTFWTTITAMVVDFLGNPDLDAYDLGSLRWMMGGGAAMPVALAQSLADRGIPYFEGYGLSETMAPTHLNPRESAKQECLGIPIFDTHSMVIDPATLEKLPDGDVGEIVLRGPQLFNGYWQNVEATREAFVLIDGERWFRTGDLGRIDEDGYFFMVDRLKRMINASGLKVWPAEVESFMYKHPAIQEACVIAAQDARRGETVKALVVLKAAHRGKITPQEIIDWGRATMAAYKAPRIVEFVDHLPKSATGKVAWRVLQDEEHAK
jgi:fatty-acyl-CoA synthase